MVRPIVAALLWLTAGPAAAESLPVDAGPLRTVISAAACAGLVSHLPAPDVDYRPGVDAYGRPVAPADLPGAPAPVFPDVYRIPIEVDLFDRYGIPADPRLFDGAVQVGTVTLVGARLFFNGQPLTPVDEAAVARACRAARR